MRADRRPVAHRRARPAGRRHRRHDPLLRPRGPAASPPEQPGRHRLYGPEHLERLEPDPRAPGASASRWPRSGRIVDVDRPGPRRPLRRRQGAATPSTSSIERSGLDADLVARPARGRAAPRPERVRSARPTTTPTSALLRAVAELRSIGMTDDILSRSARIYVDHFGALQRDVLDMLSGQGEPGVGRRRARRGPAQLTANAQRLMPAINQRPELRAPAHAAAPHPRSRAHAPDRRRGGVRSTTAQLLVEVPDARGVAAGDARPLGLGDRRPSSLRSCLREYGQSLPWCG